MPGDRRPERQGRPRVHQKMNEPAVQKDVAERRPPAPRGERFAGQGQGRHRLGRQKENLNAISDSEQGDHRQADQGRVENSLACRGLRRGHIIHGINHSKSFRLNQISKGSPAG